MKHKRNHLNYSVAKALMLTLFIAFLALSTTFLGTETAFTQSDSLNGSAGLGAPCTVAVPTAKECIPDANIYFAMLDFDAYDITSEEAIGTFVDLLTPDDMVCNEGSQGGTSPYIRIDFECNSQWLVGRFPSAIWALRENPGRLHDSCLYRLWCIWRKSMYLYPH